MKEYTSNFFRQYFFVAGLAPRVDKISLQTKARSRHSREWRKEQFGVEFSLTQGKYMFTINML
jgi:hypothetical protein